MTDSIQSPLNKEIKMQEHSDNDVIKEVLNTIEKFLAGTIEAKEITLPIESIFSK